LVFLIKESIVKLSSFKFIEPFITTSNSNKTKVFEFVGAFLKALALKSFRLNVVITPSLKIIRASFIN
jgi:hypothetical protein